MLRRRESLCCSQSCFWARNLRNWLVRLLRHYYPCPRILGCCIACGRAWCCTCSLPGIVRFQCFARKGPPRWLCQGEFCHHMTEKLTEKKTNSPFLMNQTKKRLWFSWEILAWDPLELFQWSTVAWLRRRCRTLLRARPGWGRAAKDSTQWSLTRSSHSKQKKKTGCHMRQDRPR